MKVRPARKFFHRYLPIPRQLVASELATISDAQLRVYLYLLHRTVGFDKLSDAPAIDEICSGIRTKSGRVIDVGTGLKRSTVKRALKDLAEMEWITVKREHNKPNTYTVSRFLRVQNLTLRDSPDGPLADPQDGQFLNPPLKQEIINNVKCAGKVVPIARAK